MIYYLEELSSHRVAEIIGEETGAVPLLFDSCHNVTRRQFEEGVTYLRADGTECEESAGGTVQMSQPLLKCEHVDFGYENYDVVKDVSLEICQGDYLCIVGETDSGKSTLMKGLLGLLKPTGGSLMVSKLT